MVIDDGELFSLCSKSQISQQGLLSGRYEVNYVVNKITET